ncbi:hypothetical protein SEUCBS139899_005236 [Sporothrix eucalyptigena]|uniref:Uncharacterized protein n=1 Tax=Sporothrix eucalyptigena TaxID=1812306 RepID=A0ABP0BII3_9PEZI
MHLLLLSPAAFDLFVPVELPQHTLRPLANLPAQVPVLSGAGPSNPGTLSDSAPSSFHDRYDRYEHIPTPSRQRSHSQKSKHSSVQRPFTPQEHSALSALSERDARSTPNSQRSLRRTSRFTASPAPSEPQLQTVSSPADSRPRQSGSPRRIHLAAVSTGISPRLAFATAKPVEHHHRPDSPRGPASQDLSDDEDDNEDDKANNSSVAGRSSRPASAFESKPAVERTQHDTHPAVRISKRTHNAILFAIEGLTHPYKLSSDYEEETAKMADLLGDDGSNGNGNLTRPQMPAPAPTSSPRSNIRGPRMIMQERQEREARKAERERIERERMERAQAEQDARVLAEQKRQAAERAAERERAAAAIAAAAAANPPPTNTALPGMFSSNAQQAVDPATQRRQQRAERTAAASSGQLAPPPAIQQQTPQQPPISSQPPPQQQQPQQRPVRVPQGAQIPQQQPINQNPISSAPPPAASVNPGASTRPTGQAQPPLGAEGGDAGQGGAGRPRNSFPHAFERWEALSAHWEGLTSFWIRQLQQRSEEINQDPLNRQLARQVTDLSAAGANLFHAVVELQRLRASSERKFQRWFFEMRGDMERNTEVHAMLEAAIQEERRGRAEAIREAVENERSNSKIQKQLAEMRKELAISKDEARRAWEELGRREQEERDRLIALQEGHPTIVGGVQVVPMTQGLPVRQRANSNASHEQHPQQQQPPPPQAPPPQQQPQQQQQAPPQQYQQQAPPPQQAQQQHQPASALEQLPSQTQRYQPPPQQQPVHSQPPTSVPATAGGEYYQQQQGHSSEGAPQGSDETYEEEELRYGTPSSLSAPGSTYPPSASQHYYATPAPADYSGQGFAGPGWETIPRHHHPTRLSDVIEEDDERSRTSASQVSRGDR